MSHILRKPTRRELLAFFLGMAALMGIIVLYTLNTYGEVMAKEDLQSEVNRLESELDKQVIALLQTEAMMVDAGWDIYLTDEARQERLTACEELDLGEECKNRYR